MPNTNPNKPKTMDTSTASTLLQIARDISNTAAVYPDAVEAGIAEILDAAALRSSCVSATAQWRAACVSSAPMSDARPGPIHTPTPRIAQDLEDIYCAVRTWREVAAELTSRLRNTTRGAQAQHRADCRTLNVTLENLDAASPAAEDVPDDYDTETPINPAAVAIEGYLCEQGQWKMCDEAAAFADLRTALLEISDHACTVLGCIDSIRTAQDKRLILTQRHG
jgi:hypothetical protein